MRADLAVAVDVIAVMNELNTTMLTTRQEFVCTRHVRVGEGFYEKAAVSFKPTGKQHSHMPTMKEAPLVDNLHW